MGNCASAKVEGASSAYSKEIMEIRRHMKCVCRFWNADEFVIHREQARLIIDVIKRVWHYVKKPKFSELSFPIPIQIYWLLDSLYSSLQEVRSLEVFWDFTPSMGVGLLSCRQDLSDLLAWTARLGMNIELPINPLRQYQHVRSDDPQAVIIQGIIENAEGGESVSLSPLVLERDVILPFLSRIDREYMAEKMGDKIHIRRNRSLVEKKKEFLRNILEGAEYDDGHGVPPLHVVDGGELSGTFKLVGRGSFGNVYQVGWLGSLCALKEFEYDEKYWIEEANILSKLCHPNIVTVFGYVQRTSFHPHHGILMELLGNSLQDIIFKRNAPTRRPFTNMVALDIIHQIARAMECLHRQNIIHRDLKPANVLAVAASPHLEEEDAIRGRLRVKLIDFGLAKLKEKGCNTETLTSRQGSTRYRAPEVLQGKDTARYNLSADVYSFGVTFFEIFTGKEGNEKAVTFLEIFTGKEGNENEISKDSSMGKRITGLLQRCLDPTPRNRPSFQYICRRLENIIYDLAIEQGGDYC